MSNNIEASIKSAEEEMITPSAQTNENTCEVRSESRDQFVGPALRRHSLDTAAIQPTSVWNCRLRLMQPTTGWKCRLRVMQLTSGWNCRLPLRQL